EGVVDLSGNKPQARSDLDLMIIVNDESLAPAKSDVASRIRKLVSQRVPGMMADIWIGTVGELTKWIKEPSFERLQIGGSPCFLYGGERISHLFVDCHKEGISDWETFRLLGNRAVDLLASRCSPDAEEDETAVIHVCAKAVWEVCSLMCINQEVWGHTAEARLSLANEHGVCEKLGITASELKDWYELRINPSLSKGGAGETLSSVREVQAEAERIVGACFEWHANSIPRLPTNSFSDLVSQLAKRHAFSENVSFSQYINRNLSESPSVVLRKTFGYFRWYGFFANWRRFNKALSDAGLDRLPALRSMKLADIGTPIILVFSAAQLVLKANCEDDPDPVLMKDAVEMLPDKISDWDDVPLLVERIGYLRDVLLGRKMVQS
ncbi:hypothetical protein BVX97_00795, partial [bacterium E08(2017)]